MFTRSNSSHPATLSRRDFLKLGGIGLTGFFLPDIRRLEPIIEDQLGRVIDPHIVVYDVPSLKEGKEVRVYWKDDILPISEITIGDDEPAYNRVWYQIGNEGYAHSGAIQPVRRILNEPNPDIPKDGRLAEVTVPYTDAYWSPIKESSTAYRYYYETTYWVTGLIQGNQGMAWYKIKEDKWNFVFYAPAQHLRLVPYEELSPLSPDLPPILKRLEVRLADQVLIAYEINRPVFMARVATGARFRTGNYETPKGTYLTFHKRPSRHMAAGDIASNGYDLPGVPWVCYFTEEGLSLHGTFWHNDFGKPRSHGCINLTPQAAKWVYRWTQPVVPATEQKVFEDYGTVLNIVE